MKFTAYHASDGDCLLLATDNDSVHVLVDGGRKGSFEDFTRDDIAALDELDVICVSHIDNDHISGILSLMEDEVAWRVHAARLDSGEATQEPTFPKPPPIAGIWHNALFQILGDADPDVQPISASVVSMAGMAASLLAGSANDKHLERADSYRNLALGEKSSFELSRRISDEQLEIPLNEPSGGDDTMMLRDDPGDAIDLGDLRIFILGPTQEQLDALRVEWVEWNADNAKAIADLHARMVQDEDELGTLAAGLVANPVLETALGDGLSGVSKPNLASLMFLVEDDSHTVLMTGDGVSDDILDGLGHYQKLNPQGRIHVDVLKVQHHAAKANVTEEFVQRVTADHYVFCGNGSHHNPELEVIEKFTEARLTGVGGSGPVGPATGFKFWFTSSAATPDTTETQNRSKHMEEVEEKLEELVNGSNGRLTTELIPTGKLEVLP